MQTANTLEIVKAAMTAYNDKDWAKLKEVFAPDAMYDEKGTHRRLQGIGPIIGAWQGWATAFPDSQGTFVREFTSGDTVVLEVVWKGLSQGHCRCRPAPFQRRISGLKFQRVRSFKSEAAR